MARVYIGKLSYQARERDVERFFKGFGRLVDITVKNGFGFVEFEDARDADEAVYELNGKDMMGMRVIVERARDSSRDGRWGGPPPRDSAGTTRHSSPVRIEPLAQAASVGRIDGTKRARHGLEKRWSDVVREDLELIGLVDDWYRRCQDRSLWRRLLKVATGQLKVAALQRAERRAAKHSEVAQWGAQLVHLSQLTHKHLSVP
ncbi:uncharacterized protein LOC144940643 [Lampetra fluviatilis]